MQPSSLAGDVSGGRYRIDDIVVDSGQRKLWRGSEPLPVTRLTFQLLLTLIDRAPNVVAHDEIIERVWGPRRVVSPETLSQCVLRLRHVLGDDAASPRFIESIRGQGYRLIPPVRPSADADIVPGADIGSVLVPRRKWGLPGSKAALAALSALVILAALGLGRLTREPVAVASAPATPPVVSSVKPRSIAVLPFATAGMDDDDAVIADGIHADILNELARVGELHVIARATMRKFAATDFSVAEIADELNVASVMQLDLRLTEGNLELQAELIDGQSGAQQWFARYDGHLGNVQALELELTAGIAAELGARLSEAEQARLEARPTTSAEAYEFFLRAAEAFEIDFSDRAMIARTYLDKAIALDPDFARAYGFKALIYAYGIDYFTDSAEDLRVVHAERARLAEQFALRALELDPAMVVAHRARALAAARSWRWTAAKASFQSALEHGPNDVLTLAEYAFFGVCALRDGASMRYFTQALELDPDNSRLHELHGEAFNCLRDREAALAALRRSVELEPASFRVRSFSAYTASHIRPADDVARELQALEPLLTDNSPQAYAAIALTYFQIGRYEDARRLVARYEALNGHERMNLGNSVFAYLAAGENDAAYATLKRAVAQLGPGSGLLTLLIIRENQRGIPALDEPRFVDLRSRIRSLD